MYDNIVMFTQLVEIGSFSKVAETLHIATSTISRRIRDLEAYFNKTLLLRDTRNIELTVDGEIVYNHFKALRSQLQNTYEILNPQEKKLAGELNVALPSVFSNFLITPYISYFNKKHPNITLNIYYQHTSTKVDLNNINLAINDNPERNDAYDYRFLRSDTIQLFCTSEYAKKYSLPIRIEDLADHNLIGAIAPYDDLKMNHITCTNQYTKEIYLLDMSNSKLNINVGTQGIQIGLNNEHIFWSWSFLCDDMIKTGAVIRVLPEYYVYQSEIYITSRKHISAEEQAFIDFIYRCMNGSIITDIQNDLKQDEFAQ